MPACRAAQNRDLPLLLELERQTFDGDRLSARQLRHHLDSPSAELRVIPGETGGIDAYALWFYRRGSQRARLYSLAVAAAARGRGLAQALMADGEHLARKRGARWLSLEVRQDNQAAQNLYLKLGFEVSGHRAGYYEDGMDAVRMLKSLTAELPQDPSAPC